MSTFVPFRAWRPLPARVKEVACRPYDVLSAEEARQECAGNRLSFYHVIKPEIDFPDDADHHSPDVYRKGKASFDKLVAQKIMLRDAEDSFYAYRLKMPAPTQAGGAHTQTGLVGCCSIDDYFGNVIKKHELTRPDKEEDRTNHVRFSGLHYEPVFFAHPPVAALDKLVQQACKLPPEYRFTADDQVQHSLWKIDHPDAVRQITSLFRKQVPAIYVADGHHRTAAAALAGRELRERNKGNAKDGHRYNYFMAVCFPSDQLQIMDYNRVVKDLGGFSPREFLARLEESFFVTPAPENPKPKAQRQFGLYLAGKWHRLIAKPGTWDEDDPVGCLDVTLLSEKILSPLLNITDLRTDQRIDFTGGIRGLAELERRVNSGEMAAAFALFPVSMQQLMDISDSGQIMPPKTTWFEPKLRSGLFVHSLEG